MSTESITLARIQALETSVAALQRAVQNLASVQQLRQLLAIRQQEINELTERLDDLESQISILQTS